MVSMARKFFLVSVRHNKVAYVICCASYTCFETADRIKYCRLTFRCLIDHQKSILVQFGVGIE